MNFGGSSCCRKFVGDRGEAKIKLGDWGLKLRQWKAGEIEEARQNGDLLEEEKETDLIFGYNNARRFGDNNKKGRDYAEHNTQQGGRLHQISATPAATQLRPSYLWPFA